MAEGNGKETDHDVLKHSDVENAGTEVAEAALLSEPIALGSEEAYQEPGALGSITVDTKEQMEVSCPESGTFVKSNVDVKEQSIDTKEQMEISCPETGALVNSTVDAKEQPGPQSGNVELKVMNQTGNAADYGGTSNGKQENGSDLSKFEVTSDKPMVDVKAAEVQSGGDHMEEELMKKDIVVADSENPVPSEGSKVPSFLNSDEGDESGTEADQAAFMKELENFHRERSLEFKPPKFYGEGLNCLKLWRAVTRLGGYEQVTSCKLWRQVGESFKPPKTCTTVSWTFRGFYEKALLEYEKHKIRTGELQVSIAPMPESVSIDNQIGGSQAPGSGRARRDAAARAMQGWHSQRLLSNGEVGDPIIKDKSSVSLLKRDKQFKNIGVFKKKKISQDHPIKAGHTDTTKPQVDAMIVDLGAPADWVKINVRRTKDCFEIYALVPGLLREEVHVQSDPVGRLVISGEPEQPDNPWGVTPFKKIVSLPARIDPHQTSAVVTLHGQLFVRAPFEQSGQ